MDSPDPFLTFGTIVKAHGLRGEVQVTPCTGCPEAFSLCRRLYFLEENGSFSPVKVLEVRAKSPRALILALEGVDGRSGAEALVGRSVFGKKDALPELPEGEYYRYQLVGLTVRSVDGTELGTLAEIFTTGAHDVYVMKGCGGEVFIPATDQVIRKIDLGAGLMVVDLPPGLAEANAL